MLSILMSANRMLGYLPAISSAHYAKRSLISNMALEEHYTEYKKNGWLTLQTHFNLDKNKLDDLLAFETFYVKEDPLKTIKELINKGYYIYMEVDRYYFPGGVEYLKTHLYHRTLIYGYDDNDKSLFLLEDCVRLGYTDHYILSYEDFNKVTLEAFDHSEGSIELLCCKVKSVVEDLSVITSNVESRIINNLQHYLTNQIVEHDDIYYDTYGIITILEYADSIHNIVPFIEDYPILQAVSKMPIDLQKRNLLTISLLDELGKLNNDKTAKLTLLYKEILRDWELFRNLIYIYLEKKKKNDINLNYIDKIKILLSDVYKKEKKTSELLIKILS